MPLVISSYSLSSAKVHLGHWLFFLWTGKAPPSQKPHPLFLHHIPHPTSGRMEFSLKLWTTWNNKALLSGPWYGLRFRLSFPSWQLLIYILAFLTHSVFLLVLLLSVLNASIQLALHHCWGLPWPFSCFWYPNHTVLFHFCLFIYLFLTL